MVAPVIAAGAMALIRLIAWLSSVVFVSSYVRDIATKNKEEQIQTSQDSTVDQILNNSTLTAEQKQQLVIDYMNANSTGTSSTASIDKYIPYIIIGFIGVALLGRR